MTREEATNMLKAKLECLKRETSGTDFDCNNSNCDECSLCYEQGNMGEQKEALDMAIKALERQSEDAISRKAVVKYIKASDAELGHDSENEIVVEDILNMPPVTPVACIATVKFSKEDMQELIDEKMKDIVVERKKGKWINKSSMSGCGIRYVASECSCCHKKTLFNCDELIYKYCPNCGAEMESEE